ncbi:carbon-nitrogen hydrolase family protein [Aliikangiella sp. G2MR2-5]|uniref:carbon-nitrogen hydrolase family protein n=1 Tax=Aliikangiella sp. G2MR2-5 TaxID=2788943 RepID=UPI0018A92FFD|nr:carbon-nitrogen hydrolase family protein [Aliikangiella sp. G2MR2-5]
MSKFCIAALQLALPNQNNLLLLQTEIESAKKRFPWIDMFVLGELNAYGTDVTQAQGSGGEFERTFSNLARKLNCWIIPGSYFEKSDSQVFNTSPVINPQGEIIARHRKIFPFLPYEQGVDSGESFVVFEAPGKGKIGLLICYDQWFPEVSRTLAWLGAEVIVCPTLTNTIDRENELVLARANATVNQCYFFNVNACDQLGFGQSIVVGPQGETIYQASVGREIIPIEVDFEQVRSVRERGLHGLCQTLKSFRDNRLKFPVYLDSKDLGELGKLGELKLPDSN